MSLNLRAINKSFCDALGLDPSEVAGITIHLSPTALPEVTVRMQERTERLADVIATFELRPKDGAS